MRVRDLILELGTLPLDAEIAVNDQLTNNVGEVLKVQPGGGTTPALVWLVTELDSSYS